MTSSFKGTYFRRDVALVDQSIDLSKLSSDIADEITGNGFALIQSQKVTVTNVTNFSIECVEETTEGRISNRYRELVLFKNDQNIHQRANIKIVADISYSEGDKPKTLTNVLLVSQCPIVESGEKTVVSVVKYLGTYILGYQGQLEELDVHYFEDPLETKVFLQDGTELSEFDDVTIKYQFAKLLYAYVSVDSIGKPDLTFVAATYNLTQPNDGTTGTLLNITASGHKQSFIQYAKPIDEVLVITNPDTVNESSVLKGGGVKENGFRLNEITIEARGIKDENGHKYIVLSEIQDDTPKLGHVQIDAEINYIGSSDAAFDNEGNVNQGTTINNATFALDIPLSDSQAEDKSQLIEVEHDEESGMYIIKGLSSSGMQVSAQSVSPESVENLEFTSVVFNFKNDMALYHEDRTGADNNPIFELLILDKSESYNNVFKSSTQATSGGNGTITQNIDTVVIEYFNETLDFGFKGSQKAGYIISDARVDSVEVQISSFKTTPTSSSEGIANISSIKFNGEFLISDEGIEAQSSIEIKPADVEVFEVPIKILGDGFAIYSNVPNKGLELVGDDITAVTKATSEEITDLTNYSFAIDGDNIKVYENSSLVTSIAKTQFTGDEDIEYEDTENKDDKYDFAYSLVEGTSQTLPSSVENITGLKNLITSTSTVSVNNLEVTTGTRQVLIFTYTDPGQDPTSVDISNGTWIYEHEGEPTTYRVQISEDESDFKEFNSESDLISAFTYRADVPTYTLTKIIDNEGGDTVTLFIDPTFVINEGNEVKIVPDTTEESSNTKYLIVLNDQLTEPFGYPTIGFTVISGTTALDSKFHFKDLSNTVATFNAASILYTNIGIPTRDIAVEFSKDAGFLIPKINEQTGEPDVQHIHISDLVQRIQQLESNSLIPYESERLHALEVALAYITSDLLEDDTSSIAKQLRDIKARYAVLEPEDA